MLRSSLLHISRICYQYLEAFTRLDYWRVYAVGLGFLLAITFAFPHYDVFLPGNAPHPNWEYVETQIQAPLSAGDYSPESHAAKRAFRLLVPVVGYLTGIHSPPFFILLQHLFGLLFFYLALRLAERITQDKVAALLLLAGIVGIYLGKSFFWDIGGWFDGIAFFFLLLAMYSRSYWVLFLSLTLAFWTDERAILASTLVYLWWKFSLQDDLPLSLKNLLLPNPRNLIIIATWACYLGLRTLLTQQYGLSVPMGEEGAIGFQRWELFLPALLTAFEGLWLLLLPLGISLWNRSSVWLALALLLATGIVMIPALMVADITRSLTYAFPLIFIGLQGLQRTANTLEIRNFLLILAACCLLFPNLVVISTIRWIHPMVPGLFVEHQY